MSTLPVPLTTTPFSSKAAPSTRPQPRSNRRSLSTIHSSTDPSAASSSSFSLTQVSSSSSTSNIPPPVFSPPKPSRQTLPDTNGVSASSRRSSAEFGRGDDGRTEEEIEEEQCPSCLGPNVPLPPNGSGRGRGEAGGLIWISCSKCDSWFHYACIRTRDQNLPPGLGPDTGDWKAEVDQIDKWYCLQPNCISTHSLQPTLKPSASRKSSRPKKATQIDYHSLNNGIPSLPSVSWPDRFAEYECQGRITLGGYGEMEAEDVGVKEWVVGMGGCEEGWDVDELGPLGRPIVVRGKGEGGKSMERMGGKMPSRSLTVQDIAKMNGRSTPVEVVDVANQGSSKVVPGTTDPWTLGAWADYYSTPSEEKKGIFNIISYEISGTKLAKQVIPPRIVSELDWCDRFWPSADKASRPKVQLYCLMSPAGCWTDWHVDFAGSSVYYHVMNGSKVFYFIRPTKQNLDAYAKWSDSESQATTWLGDIVDRVWKIVLGPGDTMIIPSGWIHAVYTPSDTLVFGGNFLHSYNIPIQLRLREIEIATRVPQKFRFPKFTKLCWHVADHYNRDLQALQKIRSTRSNAPPPLPTTSATSSSGSPLLYPHFNAIEPLTPRLLDNLLCLAQFLVRQIRFRERGLPAEGEKDNDLIPLDRIKDPAGLARELRWRAKLAMGEDSDDEGGEDKALSGAKGRNGKGVGKKESSERNGKRRNGSVLPKGEEKEEEESREDVSRKKRKLDVKADPKFVDTRPWDASEFTPPVIQTRQVSLPRPVPPAASSSSSSIIEGSTSSDEPATETSRTELQVRTRQMFGQDGEVSVEISTTQRTIVRTVWEKKGSRRDGSESKPEGSGVGERTTEPLLEEVEAAKVEPVDRTIAHPSASIEAPTSTSSSIQPQPSPAKSAASLPPHLAHRLLSLLPSDSTSSATSSTLPLPTNSPSAASPYPVSESYTNNTITSTDSDDSDSHHLASSPASTPPSPMPFFSVDTSFATDPAAPPMPQPQTLDPISHPASDVPQDDLPDTFSPAPFASTEPASAPSFSSYPDLNPTSSEFLTSSLLNTDQLDESPLNDASQSETVQPLEQMEDVLMSEGGESSMQTDL